MKYDGVNKEVDYWIRPIKSEFHVVSESLSSESSTRPYYLEVELDEKVCGLLPMGGYQFFEKGRMKKADLTKLRQKLLELRDLLKNK